MSDRRGWAPILDAFAGLTGRAALACQDIETGHLVLRYHVDDEAAWHERIPLGTLGPTIDDLLPDGDGKGVPAR